MAVLAAAPFAGSLAGGFVYDDHVLIEERSAVHSLGGLSELWRGEFWEGLGAVHFRYLRPVVSTSYAIDWAIWGGRPLGFHITNLLLHAVVALMLFIRLTGWTGATGAAWGVVAATLAWAWHPSKVEAVSWIAGRTDVLCALGILVACAGVKSRLSGKLPVGIALEIAGLVIALGSKEHGVVAPAFVAVEAWAHFGRRPLDRNEVGRALTACAPHALAVAVYLGFRFFYLPIVPERVGSLSFLDARLYTLETLGEFARIVFYPFPLSIQRAPIRIDSSLHVVHESARLLWGIGFVAAIALALVFFCRGRHFFRVVGCLLGLAALAPVANIMAARMVFLFAERFAYLPLMGFAMCAVPAERVRAWSSAPWAVALLACATLSARHTRNFLDDRHLWEHELAENPRQPLALRFACEDAMRQHRYRDALDFALRGYEASQGWSGPQPDRVNFAVRAARSLELLTLDADRVTLAEVVRFYETFLSKRGTARLETNRVRLAIDAGGPDARSFRKADAARGAMTKLWAAVAATRVDRCDIALPWVRDYLSETAERTGGVSAALVLARCERWDEALRVARELDTTHPAIAELVRNLETIKSLAQRRDSGPEAAIELSRARTLLLDRRGAFRALLPFRDAMLANPDAALFFARAAWAAGEDESARQALAVRLTPEQSAELLAGWSRELGRAD